MGKRDWMHSTRRTAATVVMMAMMAGTALPAAQAQSTMSEHVNTGKVVEFTTGINPDNYPCARDAIVKLYHKRSNLSDLSSYHPKRIFTWIADTSIYYTYRFIDFLKGLMNPDALVNGIRKVQSMARGDNPLAGMDSKIEGWARDLSPRSQFVLQKKVHGIIHNTTNEDGSCKQ